MAQSPESGSVISIVLYPDSELSISAVTIDAIPGGAAFDWTGGGNTPGTGSGASYTDSGGAEWEGRAYLQNIVGLYGNPPTFYGDLYGQLFIDFSDRALQPGTQAYLHVATVTLSGDVTQESPEPATILLSVPLLALVARRRYRRSNG